MSDNTTSENQIKKWEKLSSSLALPEPWFRVRKDEVKLASGKVVNGYLVWESPDIATMVPFTADGKFVLCEQYRYAVDKIMYQFPQVAWTKMNRPKKLQDANSRKRLATLPIKSSF